MTTGTNWVDLDGVVNMRDLGGHTTADGRTVRSAVVLRSDNLAGLTPASVSRLMSDYHLSDVVDLRTNMEHAHDGVWPFGERVELHKMSLYPEDDPSSLVPPWHGELGDTAPANEPGDHAHASARHYLGYFRMRPDSLVGTLRTVAGAQGATIINCAAGKDRTGVACALLLTCLGVPADQVIADYAASDAKVPAILARLGLATTAGSPEHREAVAAQATPPEAMALLLERVATELGGVPAWLAAHGWQPDDQTALEARLLA